MGKVTFTQLQQVVFDKFSKNSNLNKSFYFGGGTALSIFYLQHRYSEDLDFFSEKELDKDFLIKFIHELAGTLKTEIKMTKKETVLLFQLQSKKELLKIDFLHFPYPRIEKGTMFNGVTVDSPLDIGANKLMLINLHPEVKDYVDLYFLLKKKYTVWDLIYAVEKKYKLKLDLITLGEDFFNVRQFNYLPKMIKPLILDELKIFFQKLAREIGKRTIIV